MSEPTEHSHKHRKGHKSNQNNASGKKWSEWGVTSLLALAVAGCDVVVLAIPQLTGFYKIALFGMVTFFGLMIVSGHHEMKKKGTSIGKGKGKDSHVADPKNPIKAPISVTAIGYDGEVLLSWVYPSDGGPVEKFKIIDTTDSKNTKIIDTVKNIRSHKIKGLSNGTEYHFKIISINKEGKESDPSIEAAATPSAGKGKARISGGTDQWEGEIMRTAIAGSLVLVYIIVIGFTMYPSGLVLNSIDQNSSDQNSITQGMSNPTILCDFVNNSTIHYTGGNNQTINCREHTLRESVLSNFGIVIVSVVGFYFASKSAKQIIKMRQGSSDQTASDNSDSSQPPDENQ